MPFDLERFEWDDSKAASNLAHHGVSFAEASGVFYDPLAVTQPDDEHSESEDRYLIIGKSTQGRLLVVAYTQRGGRWRIISARRAAADEREAYEEEG